MNSSIPVCYFPMRKFMLDDDEAFSESIKLKMLDKNFLTFNLPHKALQFLKSYKPTFSKADLVALNPEVEYSRTQSTVDIHLNTLNKIQQVKQNQDISVLMVDYHMPGMSGLDFLLQIQSLPIKKILITGEKDYRIGIQAFNDGLVDAYIRKDDHDFPSKIQNTIYDLEWAYFSDMSEVIYTLPNLNYLTNKYLISAFQKYIREKNISSFYLTDVEGTFSLESANGEKHALLIRNKSQLQTLSKIAKEDGASSAVIENLEQGKAIPFFKNNEFWQVSADKWDDFLHPANTILGEPNIVWTTTNY